MQRVLLKLSGEILGTDGFDPAMIGQLADELIAAQREHDIELAVVLGGGNIWRGRDFAELAFDPAYADSIGMGATVLNALVLAGAIRQRGGGASVFSPLPLTADVHPHHPRAEVAALHSGEIIFLGGGTGNPYFTTDTTAVLRALELQADAVLKGTKVDGVYDADPQKHPHAKRFDVLTFDQALEHNLGVMDATAFAMAREHQLPVCVFNALQPGAIAAVISGDDEQGTWVRA